VFLIVIFIGSEWPAGLSMRAELWPQEARGRGASLTQCGFGIGFFIVSLLWLFISAFKPNAWR
jgi:MFS family permease